VSVPATVPVPVVGTEVAEALGAGRPVVALETAVLTHGLPPPDNRAAMAEMAAAVRAEGAVPAVVGVLDGLPRVGLTDRELDQLAAGSARKASLRDLPLVMAAGGHGGTTVAATLWLAHRAGLRVMATGGIGGVHRNAPHDVSADLPALAAVPLVLVASGAKAVLDLAGTLEWLEMLGVPVIGYGTDRLPAFYWPDSGLPVPARVDSPQAVAAIARARDALGLRQALLVAVPVPAEAALDARLGEAAVRQANAEGAAERPAGPALTPELLRRVAELTGGASLVANRALLANNARVAARIARAMGAAAPQPPITREPVP
jgi:pseudouridine-5'-phosphate glycosidase